MSPFLTLYCIQIVYACQDEDAKREIQVVYLFHQAGQLPIIRYKATSRKISQKYGLKVAQCLLAIKLFSPLARALTSNASTTAMMERAAHIIKTRL